MIWLLSLLACSSCNLPDPEDTADTADTAETADIADTGPDTGQAAPCVPSAPDGTDVCVFIDSSMTHAVPANFGGMALNMSNDGLHAWDDDLIAMAKEMNLGHLRSNMSPIYDWPTGWLLDDDVAIFDDNDDKSDKYTSYQEVTRGMGYLKVADLARLSQQLGTPLVLMVNVFTGGYNDLQGDTDALAEGAAVAGAYAAMTIERGYDVALWEVGSETFNWANSNHDPKIFDGGYGYVEATKLYFDAITQAYVDAELVPPPINISVSDGGETSWQREFDGMDLEDGTFDAGDALGVAGYGSIFDPVAEHEKYWTGWSHHWYPGVLTYLDGDKVINHDCPAESARYWELLQADVNHRLVNTATQSVDEYFLPLSGMDGLEDEALPGLKAAITEYNMRFPTDQADSAYSAVHAVESAMRWSSHARVDKVTYYALTAKGLGMVSNHRSNVSHQGNINRVLDTQDLDFDLFWHMPGLAMSLLGRAINTADVRLETTLEGGLTTNPGGGSGGQSGGHGGGPTVGEVCPRAIRSCRLSHRLTGRSAQGLSQTWAAPA